MYVATRPSRCTEVTLCVTSVHRDRFDGQGSPAPGLATFTGDLATPYGATVRDDVFDRPHVSYAAMTDTLVRRAGVEPELVVVAYSVPEIDPRRCVVTRLNAVATGDPYGFAVSDQGTAAPFTALRLLRAHLSTGACATATLVVLEQGELPYDTPAGTVLPTRDTAVAFGFGGAGAHRVTRLQQWHQVAPSEVDTLVGAEPDRLDTRVDGSLCTAPWWALADALADPTRRRTVLVDYDETVGCLSLLAVETDSVGSE